MLNKKLLFNPQVPNKNSLINTYATSVEDEDGNNPILMCSSDQVLESEIVHLDNTEECLSINDVPITESSWIDWDDQKKLESFVKRQKSLECFQGFDPASYFGGMQIDDLEIFEKDSRLSEMFKNASALQSKMSTDNLNTEVDVAKIEEYTKLLQEKLKELNKQQKQIKKQEQMQNQNIMVLQQKTTNIPSKTQNSRAASNKKMNHSKLGKKVHSTFQMPKKSSTQNIHCYFPPTTKHSEKTLQTFLETSSMSPNKCATNTIMSPRTINAKQCLTRTLSPSVLSAQSSNQYSSSRTRKQLSPKVQITAASSYRKNVPTISNQVLGLKKNSQCIQQKSKLKILQQENTNKSVRKHNDTAEKMKFISVQQSYEKIKKPSVTSDIQVKIFSSPKSKISIKKAPFGLNQAQNIQNTKVETQSVLNPINSPLFQALMMNKTSLLKQTLNDMSIEKTDFSQFKSLKSQRFQQNRPSVKPQVMKSPVATSRELGSVLSKKKNSVASIFTNRVCSPMSTSRKNKFNGKALQNPKMNKLL